MRRAPARLLRHFSIVLLLLASHQAHGQKVPYPCPSPYGFFTQYDFVSDRNYQYSFMFNIGMFFPSIVGPAVGSYTFPTMTSTNGEARLQNGRIAAHCTAQYVPTPPFAKPLLVLYVVDDGISGDLQVIYTPGGDGGCEIDTSQDPVDGSYDGACGGSDEGGSGGSSSGGGMTCNEFVAEISYDGGLTWTEFDRWWECS